MNYLPYQVRIKDAPIDQRLDIALEYIEGICQEFVRLGDAKQPLKQIKLLKDAEKGWERITRYNFEIFEDEFCDVYELEADTFYHYIKDTFLNSTEDEEDRADMDFTLRKIYNHLKWSYE
jgi:hypothetical protein